MKMHVVYADEKITKSKLVFLLTNVVRPHMTHVKFDRNRDVIEEFIII